MNDSPVDGVVGRLGPRIRAEREDQGLSVTELSERSGVGRATVADLERTARTPSLDTLAKIAEGLGLPMPDLLSDRPAGPRGRPTIERTDGLESHLLGAWVEDDVQVEVFRLSITATVRRKAIRKGTRGYLTVVTGAVSAGTPATPRRLTTGGQLAYAADQPHVLTPVGGPAQVVLVLRQPLESGEEQGAAGQPRSS